MKQSSADRFLNWLYAATGLTPHKAQQLLTLEQRNTLLSGWLKMDA